MGQSNKGKEYKAFRWKEEIKITQFADVWSYILKILSNPNTCIPVVDSFWYLAKLIQFCKV